MDIELVPNQYSYMLSNLKVQPSIIDKIKEKQDKDASLAKIKQEVL